MSVFLSSRVDKGEGGDGAESEEGGEAGTTVFLDDMMSLFLSNLYVDNCMQMPNRSVVQPITCKQCIARRKMIIDDGMWCMGSDRCAFSAGFGGLFIIRVGDLSMTDWLAGWRVSMLQTRIHFLSLLFYKVKIKTESIA